MAANYGGYYEDRFIDKDLDKVICNICTKVLKDPHLTGCCGQHFCESCLNYWFKKHGKESCPHCRAEGEKLTHMLDKRLKRDIDSLKIHCTNKKEGCQWEGEVGKAECLKDHLESRNGCDYVEVECPNRCKDTQSPNARRKMKRKDLESHLQNDCPLRPYQCEYCDHTDTYEKIKGHGDQQNVKVNSHYAKCPGFEEVECPYKCQSLNEESKTLRQRLPSKEQRKKSAQKHQETDVQTKTVTRIKRKDLKKHRAECEFRPYHCTHCGLKGTYANILNHHSKCSKYPIECPNKCGTTNIKRKDLKRHRGQCPDERVKCPNECHQNKKKQFGSQAFTIKRKDLAKHLKEECIFRRYECEHCGLKDIHNILATHYAQCPEFPLECPNKCGVEDIKRKDMEDHRSQCPEEPVQCPFEFSCSETLVRRQIQQHISSNMQHFQPYKQSLINILKKHMVELEEGITQVNQEKTVLAASNRKLEMEYAELEKKYIETKQILTKNEKILKVIQNVKLYPKVWCSFLGLLVLIFTVVCFCTVLYGIWYYRHTLRLLLLWMDKLTIENSFV